jgi:hypothetical protein
VSCRRNALVGAGRLCLVAGADLVLVSADLVLAGLVLDEIVVVDTEAVVLRGLG